MAITPKNEFEQMGWSDEQVGEFLQENNFRFYRKLDDGTWCGIMSLMFTTSVCMDIGYLSSYVYRWCFEQPKEACMFFSLAKKFDDIPEHRESLRGHRYTSKTGPRIVEYDERGFAKW